MDTPCRFWTLQQKTQTCLLQTNKGVYVNRGTGFHVEGPAVPGCGLLRCSIPDYTSNNQGSSHSNGQGNGLVLLNSSATGNRAGSAATVPTPRPRAVLPSSTTVLPIQVSLRPRLHSSSGAGSSSRTDTATATKTPATRDAAAISKQTPCPYGVLFGFEAPSAHHMAHRRATVLRAYIDDPAITSAAECGMQCVRHGQDCVSFNWRLYSATRKLNNTSRCILRSALPSASEQRTVHWELYVRLAVGAAQEQRLPGNQPFPTKCRAAPVFLSASKPVVPDIGGHSLLKSISTMAGATAVHAPSNTRAPAAPALAVMATHAVAPSARAGADSHASGTDAAADPPSKSLKVVDAPTLPPLYVHASDTAAAPPCAQQLAAHVYLHAGAGRVKARYLLDSADTPHADAASLGACQKFCDRHKCLAIAYRTKNNNVRTGRQCLLSTAMSSSARATGDSGTFSAMFDFYDKVTVCHDATKLDLAVAANAGIVGGSAQKPTSQCPSDILDYFSFAPQEKRSAGNLVSLQSLTTRACAEACVKDASCTGFNFGKAFPSRPRTLCKLKQVTLTSFLLKVTQNLDLRCVLLSDPSTFGPGGPNQNTPRIQNKDV